MFIHPTVSKKMMSPYTKTLDQMWAKAAKPDATLKDKMHAWVFGAMLTAFALWAPAIVILDLAGVIKV